ncbi:hypothetical protein YC2023_002602 [Brassica napus]
MDPRNPYRPNSGYVGLLNNLQNNNVQDNFPYESYPSSVDIGASENPPFSSQEPEGPSQPEDTPVEREESPQAPVRPEGIKAAKASRNSSKGKAIEDYKSIYELKCEDLARKEKLSKMAILDTLLAKTSPLSESQETVMGLDYSYTQPSQSDDYGLGNTTESDHCSTEMNIMLDQADIEASHKIDYIAGVSDYESELNQVKDLHYQTELKVTMLEKTVSDLAKKCYGFELGLGVMVLVVMVVSMFVVFN